MSEKSLDNMRNEDEIDIGIVLRDPIVVDWKLKLMEKFFKKPTQMKSDDGDSSKVEKEINCNIEHEQKMLTDRENIEIVEKSEFNAFNYWMADLDLARVKKAGTFLDGCKVYLSGFTDHDQEQLRRVLKFAGATRLTQLVESVTHVVHAVSTAVSPDTSRLISELDLSPHNVAIEWLVESMKRGKPVPESDYSFPPPTTTDTAQNFFPPPSAQDQQADTQFTDADLLAQYGVVPKVKAKVDETADATSCTADGTATMSQVQQFLTGLTLGDSTAFTPGKPMPVEFVVEASTVLEDKTLQEQDDTVVGEVPRRASLGEVSFPGEVSKREEVRRKSVDRSGKSEELSLEAGNREEMRRKSSDTSAKYGDLTKGSGNISGFMEADETKDLEKTKVDSGSETPANNVSRFRTMIDTPGAALDTPTLERLRPQPLNLDISVTPQRWADSQPSPSQMTKRKRDSEGEGGLDKMDTPKTPYGAHWTPNPSPRTRKFYKRRVDNMPDLQLTELEKQQADRWANQPREEYPYYKAKEKEKQYWEGVRDKFLDPVKGKEEHEKFLDSLEAKGVPVIGRDPRSFDEIMEEKYQKMGKSWKTLPEDMSKRARLELEEEESFSGEGCKVLEGVVVYVAKKHAARSNSPASVVSVHESRRMVEVEKPKEAVKEVKEVNCEPEKVRKKKEGPWFGETINKYASFGNTINNPNNSIFCKLLPNGVTTSEIERHMRVFGTILNIKTGHRSRSGDLFAIVEFESEKEKARALADRHQELKDPNGWYARNDNGYSFIVQDYEGRKKRHCTKKPILAKPFPRPGSTLTPPPLECLRSSKAQIEPPTMVVRSRGILNCDKSLEKESPLSSSDDEFFQVEHELLTAKCIPQNIVIISGDEDTSPSGDPCESYVEESLPFDSSQVFLENESMEVNKTEIDFLNHLAMNKPQEISSSLFSPLDDSKDLISPQFKMFQVDGSTSLSLIDSLLKQPKVGDGHSSSAPETRQLSPCGSTISLPSCTDDILVGRVKSLALHEQGAKYLVALTNPDTVATIQEELMEDGLAMMVNPLATKVVQAVIDVTEDLDNVLEVVLKNFDILSSDKTGSKIVKKMLARIPSDQKQTITVKLEKEDVLSILLQSQHGTNVAQACLPYLQEPSVTIIADLLLRNIVKFGNNSNGSYFIQLFMTNNTKINKVIKDRLMDGIAKNVENLVKDKFGTWLAQTAVKVSQSARHVFQFSSWVRDNILDVYCDPYAMRFTSSVIEALVKICNDDEDTLDSLANKRESEKLLRELVFLMTDTLVPVEDRPVPVIVAASMDPYGHVLAREVCLQARDVLEIKNKFIEVFSEFKSELEDDMFGCLVLKGLQGLL